MAVLVSYIENYFIKKKDKKNNDKTPFSDKRADHFLKPLSQKYVMGSDWLADPACWLAKPPLLCI